MRAVECVVVVLTVTCTRLRTRCADIGRWVTGDWSVGVYINSIILLFLLAFSLPTLESGPLTIKTKPNGHVLALVSRSLQETDTCVGQVFSMPKTARGHFVWRENGCRPFKS